MKIDFKKNPFTGFMFTYAKLLPTDLLRQSGMNYFGCLNILNSIYYDLLHAVDMVSIDRSYFCDTLKWHDTYFHCFF